MQTWEVPDPSPLPGRGRALTIHDTASGARITSAPGPTARMYVCGITPYDATHIGHAATYVAFDLVNRVWRDAGHAVHYVQNVTDVDDPLLERASATGQQWRALAQEQTDRFRGDMAALNVLAPQDYVGVVESIPEVAERVVALERSGAAYRLPGGDRYFRAVNVSGFGGVSRLDRGQMLELFAERGGDPDRPGKRDALDCLLWQAARPDEPAWDSALGHGRPGWHIECTAIALDRLGSRFDLQGGGSDLAFPHHEMCAAQAQALTGEPLAEAYVHAGMVGFQGHKMSKSRGNLVFVSELRASGVAPELIRVALLAHHYREDWEWSDADIAGARQRVEAWRRALLVAQAPPAGPVLEAVRTRLADDLDAPGALRLVDDWAAMALAHPASPRRAAGESPDRPGDLVRHLLDTLLGVVLS